MSLSLNKPGLGFWLFWAALGGGWELVNVLTGHVGLTLSYQVWWLADVQPTWITVLFQIAAGAGAMLLGLHFWGHKH